MRRLAAFLLALAIPGAALAAPPVITSGAPDTVAVTLYRDPDRGNAAINRAMPRSFALIVETRTVTLPPGETVVRFEGVASGIVPQSAILFGTDPRERNRDAALLSQKGLVDAFTGQQVIVRRTDPATGKVTEESATIRSAADRLIVSTERGSEALYCSGMAQTLIYPGAPATLSAKPVLSMTTKDQPGGKTTITLAYLATGFDWDATYVGTLSDGGKTLSLLGWMTMASGDDTSFPEATAAAVAGRINRSEDTRDDTGRVAVQQARSLNKTANCWPSQRTHNVPFVSIELNVGDSMVSSRAYDREAGFRADVMVAPPPPLPAPMMAKASVVARAESLGDLKLYSIPVPVTVAARSQKQVAFLVKNAIKGTLIYRTQAGPGEPDGVQTLFRFRNRKQDGAGDPLPAGKAVLYQDTAHGRLALAEASLPDKAADEEVELALGPTDNVTLETTDEALPGGKVTAYAATIRNANPFPVRFEVDFPKGTGRVFSGISGTVIDKPAKRVWTATIPANNSVGLTYRVTDAD
ncbi:MAG: hypothetical protein QM676_08800 [Novosphingobium sp.]